MSSDQSPFSKTTKTAAPVPTGKVSRGLEFLKMAARVAAREAVGSEAERRIEQGRALLDGLSQLKGAAMKLGQTLSVELRDLLPPEIVDSLTALQDQGTAMSGAQVREILRREWGVAPESRLESFIDAPLASASIGQVHAARFAGRDIVLKVQFPGIASSIDSDVKGLGVLLKGFLAVSGRQLQLDPFLEELSQVFKQETDYRLEAGFQREFRERFSTLPGYRVPEPIDELSTQRVLAMSRERGLKPLDWLRVRQPSAELRRVVGRRILELFEIEFFQMGMVQTDPNFANFLVDDSLDRENPQVVLLDFGAVRKYEPGFREAYRQMLRLARDGSDEALLEQVFAMQLLDRREGREGCEAFIRLVRASLSPFDPARQPFSFTNQEYAREMRERAFALAQACRISPPPRPILFLHRKLGGIFNLLKAFEVDLDLTPNWERIVGCAPARPLK